MTILIAVSTCPDRDTALSDGHIDIDEVEEDCELRSSPAGAEGSSPLMSQVSFGFHAQGPRRMLNGFRILRQRRLRSQLGLRFRLSQSWKSWRQRAQWAGTRGT